MFDTYNKSPSEVRVTTHEHRAPTDDSVRILSEMEQKALDRVLMAVSVADNSFNGSVVVMANPMTLGNTTWVKFKLNGVEHKMKFDGPHGAELMAASQESWIIRLRDEIAHEIANRLTIDAVANIRAMGHNR